MPKYTQDNRPMRVDTPLGKDVLLLVGFSGIEVMSQLFSFQLDLLAEGNPAIAFDKLLGQSVTVTLELPEKKKRFFNGIVSRFSQGEQVIGQNPNEFFTLYRAEIVPQFWLLSRRAQSRIFQHVNVPDILKKVLEGLNVDYRLQGTFQPRDYCVQYRETDFNFASRVMEEEGIFYFFEHSNGTHRLVVTDAPSFNPVPEFSTVIYETVASGTRKEDRIHQWTKMQELRSGKYTLWDHCFELPHKHLEADKTIQDSVVSGTVTHKLKVGGNDKLEIYDFPGEYAQRFDGIDKGGGEQPAEVQKIFEDNTRTVGIRMQEEAALSIRIEGASVCRQFVTGHKFTLQRHFNANGDYLLTRIYHAASTNQYRSNQGEFSYTNDFQCIPAALPFRPPRVTPKPLIAGTQTAVVVGPAGEEIFTDKYSRVKVQFHWDREGQHSADSSCWVRVATHWAGKRWGAIHIPRIGQEVVVDFQEGDPDQPIIVGSVYNADQMPAYIGQGPDSKHKHDPKISGIKSCSTPGGGGYNEIRFDDAKGKEQIFLHAEHDIDQRVENDSREIVHHDRHQIIGHGKQGEKHGDQREEVYKDKHLTVHKNHVEQIGGAMELLVGGIDGPGDQDISIKSNKKETIGLDSHLHVKMNRNEKVGMNQSLSVGMNQQEKVGMNHALDAGMQIHLKAGMSVVIEAGLQLTLKAGSNFVDINPAGVFINGMLVMINTGGAPGAGAGSNPTSPQDAKEASPTKPDIADDSKPGFVSGS
jgi:type VI secretion system secreted protein VgrG